MGLFPRVSLKDAFLWAVFVLACVTCFLPFRLGEYQLAYFADDFYYYVRVAQNFATTGLSTFDGTTLTNGYHPLWLLVLTALWKLTGGHWPFFLAVETLIVLGTLMTYSLSSSILSVLDHQRVYIQFCSFWLASFYLYIGRMGMEIILTIPLTLILLRFWLKREFRFTRKTSFLSGLLASLIVLSRLDSALLLALIGLLYLSFGDDSLQGRISHLMWTCVGLFPMLLYVISNEIFFGTFGPVSALAKHLKHGYAPNLAVIRSVFLPFGPGTLIFILFSIVILFVGVLLLWKISEGRLSKNQKAVMLSLLVFPPFYLLLLAMTSEWRIFSWYDYSLVFSSLVGFWLLGLYLKPIPWLKARFSDSLFTVIAIVLSVGLFFGLQRPPQMRALYIAAVNIRSFATNHPARYAMGDCAGIAGFLLPDPLVQLEGLVMDKKFLENISQQRNLLDVLRAYDIRYYVVTGNAIEKNGCYDVTEPFQAGKSSPKMKGTFCAPPVARFIPYGSLTLIFDVSLEKR